MMAAVRTETGDVLAVRIKRGGRRPVGEQADDLDLLRQHVDRAQDVAIFSERAYPR